MRTWTVPEANAALPRLRELVEAGRHVLSAIRDADMQIEDLRIIHGAVEEADNPGHAEYAQYRRRRERAVDELAGLAIRFETLGVEVKDLEEGLVDFRGRVGKDHVYLCWKWNEPEVRHWHTLDAGFAGRREIPGIL